jgi:hypothetical protein
VWQPKPHIWQTRTIENIGCNFGASNIHSINLTDTIQNVSLRKTPQINRQQQEVPPFTKAKPTISTMLPTSIISILQIQLKNTITSPSLKKNKKKKRKENAYCR